MKLEDLKVESFVVSLNTEETVKVKGGTLILTQINTDCCPVGGDADDLGDGKVPDPDPNPQQTY